MKRATLAANSIAKFSEGAHEVLSGSYEAEQKECVRRNVTKEGALSCVVYVRSRYAPAWKAYRALRHTWLAVASIIESAKLMESGLQETDAIGIIRRLLKAQKHFTDALGGIEWEHQQQLSG